MNTFLRSIATAALAVPAAAQAMLFTVSQPQQTISGSAGTVLQNLAVNEVALVDFFPCPVTSAEKWGPLTCYQTMAGDTNGDGLFHEPAMFGKIDALMHVYLPGAIFTPRSVFWSPTIPMGTSVSGAPALRPGDTARLIGGGGIYGQVQRFLSAEQVQSALGMGASAPIVVDVDAITCDPAIGIFFSLDQDHFVNTTCGTTFVRDGDVLMIPPTAVVWTPDLRVLSLVPGCALVAYDEAQMDLFVQNANVADRNGVCVPLITDLEALDIDFLGRQIPLVVCSGAFWIPSLYFSGETTTGAALLTTENGGQIAQSACGPLATSCGGGATLGIQMGLLPTSGTQGVPSYISALDVVGFSERFVVEPQQHVIPAGTPAVLDVYTPLPFTLIAVDIVPPSVAPHAPLLPQVFFPDLYILNNPPWSTFWIGAGFTTIVTPPIPVPAKLVFQAGGPVGLNIMLSTPATVDVQ